MTDVEGNKVSVIIAAAGKGERAGFGKNKLLTEYDGETVLSRTLRAFTESGLTDEHIVTYSARDKDEVLALLPKGVKAVQGGDTRTVSVKRALEAVTGDIVLIHDGARPFVTREVIKNCITAAAEHGGAIAALPCRDTVCAEKNGKADYYVGKSGLYLVQTPQAFQTRLIKLAYSLAGDASFNDDGEVYKEFIGDLYIAEGSARNVKLTYKEDFSLLFSPRIRTGTGFDCHRLAEGRKLILGGIEIPHEKGLSGHSDADVLTHAVMDALLSAAALRDIGYHFPDTDPRFKGADSIKLLKHVLEILGEHGYAPSSIAATVMAEKPKLSPYIPAIAENLAKALFLPVQNVGIAATTLEGLGFVGREKGICASATAVITSLS